MFELSKKVLMTVSVETPFALLEEPVEILRLDSVESTKVSLGLVPEIFNAIDVVPSVGEALGVIDPHVPEGRDVESVVGLEGVREDDAVGSNLFFDDRQESFRFRIGDHDGKNLPAPLEQAEHGYLAGRSSSTFSFADASEVAFVRLDFAAQLVAGQLRGDQLPQPHVETDRRVRLHTDNLCGRPCGRACHEMLQEPRLLPGRKTTSSHVHGLMNRGFSWS